MTDEKETVEDFAYLCCIRFCQFIDTTGSPARLLNSRVIRMYLNVMKELNGLLDSMETPITKAEGQNG